MRKKLYMLLAGGLATAALLSSCVTSYSVTLPEGEGNPSYGVSFPFGNGGGGTGEDGTSFGDLPLPDFGDFSDYHLFSQEGYFLPAGIDYTGFTPDGNYFVADFNQGLSKYSGMGKYLFAIIEKLSDTDAEIVTSALSSNDAILTCFSKESGGMTPEYVVYPAEKGGNMRKIYVVGHNRITGEDGVYLMDHVSGAIDGKLPEIPGVPNPNPGKEEPSPRYSTQWLEWLINVDNGILYPKVTDGSFYSFAYPVSGENYLPSPFSIVSGSKSSRFSLSLALSREQYPYRGDEYSWKVFFREADSNASFGSFEDTPWKWTTDGDYGRFDLEIFPDEMNPVLKPGPSSNHYQMVFIVTDAYERIVSYYVDEADWTISSELYLEEAIRRGLVTGDRENVIPLPKVEPGDRYSDEWLVWLKDQGSSSRYPILDGGLSSSAYDKGYGVSSFQIWPYDKGTQTPVSASSRFGLALSVKKTSLNMEDGTRYRWNVYYRKKGDDHFSSLRENALYGYTAIGGQTTFFFDLFGNGGMKLPQGYSGEDFTYEMYFVVEDYKSGSIVGWYQADAEWNDTARAYYKEAIYGGILLGSGILHG